MNSSVTAGLNGPIAISVVSPVYRAEAIVDELVRRLKVSLSALTENYEIILVEDGGPDHSWDRIVSNAAADQRVRGIRLSRNFGQHLAITAGLFHANGERVVVMDCDLQEDPADISKLMAEADKGNDVVLTKKRNRKHAGWKNAGAALYGALNNWLSDSPFSTPTTEVGAFSLLSRKVVEQFRRIQDYHRHYLLVVRWLGFNTSYIEIDHSERFAGRSSYSLSKLIRHAIDGITSQSTRLLRISIGLGFVFCLASIAAIAWILVAYWLHGFREGWASLAVLILFSTGINLLCLGIIGLYLGRTFEQVKGRPLFIVDTSVNLAHDSGAAAQAIQAARNSDAVCYRTTTEGSSIANLTGTSSSGSNNRG